MDLPGYGYAKAPGNVRERWKHLVTSYLRRTASRSPCACSWWTCATTRSRATRRCASTSTTTGCPRLLAATKADKLGRGEVNRRTAALARAESASERPGT